MPLPFNPARAAGLARGLRLVEGGGNAARMRALVRRARATGAGTEAERAAVERAGARAAPRDVKLDVYGPEGYEKTVTRQPATRYSPEATTAQEAQTRAMERAGAHVDEEARVRHLAERGRSAIAELQDFTKSRLPKGAYENAGAVTQAQDAALRRTAEMRDKLGVTDDDMLRAFADRYGWAPRTWREAEVILSPGDYEELLGEWLR